MHSIQLPAAYPHGDRAAVDAAGRELTRRHDAVLLVGQLSELHIGSCGYFRGLIAGK